MLKLKEIGPSLTLDRQTRYPDENLLMAKLKVDKLSCSDSVPFCSIVPKIRASAENGRAILCFSVKKGIVKYKVWPFLPLDSFVCVTEIHSRLGHSCLNLIVNSHNIQN